MYYNNSALMKEFHDFIKNCDKKSVIISAGCGGHLGMLNSIPGSSSVINKIYFPYSEDSLNEFLIYKFPKKAVSKEVVYEIAQKQTLMPENSDCRVIAISGALTTNRYRKGENHAFFACCETNKNEKYSDVYETKDLSLYYLKINKRFKSDEELDFWMKERPEVVSNNRILEDQIISFAAINILMNKTKTELEQGIIDNFRITKPEFELIDLMQQN